MTNLKKFIIGALLTLIWSPALWADDFADCARVLVTWNGQSTDHLYFSEMKNGVGTNRTNDLIVPGEILDIYMTDGHYASVYEGVSIAREMSSYVESMIQLWRAGEFSSANALHYTTLDILIKIRDVKDEAFITAVMRDEFIRLNAITPTDLSSGLFTQSHNYPTKFYGTRFKLNLETRHLESVELGDLPQGIYGLSISSLLEDGTRWSKSFSIVVRK